MRTTCPLIFALIAGPAAAHPGHLAEAAGHGHWIALIALGGAAVIVALAARKTRAAKNEDEAVEVDEDESAQES